jgi:hypothetical protein
MRTRAERRTGGGREHLAAIGNDRQAVGVGAPFDVARVEPWNHFGRIVSPRKLCMPAVHLPQPIPFVRAVMPLAAGCGAHRGLAMRTIEAPEPQYTASASTTGPIVAAGSSASVLAAMGDDPSAGSGVHFTESYGSIQ